MLMRCIFRHKYIYMLYGTQICTHQCKTQYMS